MNRKVWLLPSVKLFSKRNVGSIYNNNVFYILFLVSFTKHRVCGLIVQQEDMPFNDLGICPDIVSISLLFVVDSYI